MRYYENLIITWHMLSIFFSKLFYENTIASTDFLGYIFCKFITVRNLHNAID